MFDFLKNIGQSMQGFMGQGGDMLKAADAAKNLSSAGAGAMQNLPMPGSGGVLDMLPTPQGSAVPQAMQGPKLQMPATKVENLGLPTPMGSPVPQQSGMPFGLSNNKQDWMNAAQGFQQLSNAGPELNVAAPNMTLSRGGTGAISAVPQQQPQPQSQGPQSYMEMLLKMAAGGYGR